MFKEQGKIVGDFDGTFTEPNPQYRFAAIDFLADHFHINRYQMENLFIAGEADVHFNLQQSGWKRNGRIVAPPGDIVLFTQAAAKNTIENLLQDSLIVRLRNLFTKPDDLVYKMYQAAYSSTPAIFKADAEDNIKRLAAIGRFVVVTNSSTTSVKKMLSGLVTDNNIAVVGDAQKFEVVDNWHVAVVNGQNIEIPETLTIPGLSRPAFLRREKYYNLLKSLGSVLAVFGDIHELDLLLASYLGIPTVLVTSPNNPYTPSWDNKLYAGGNDKRFLADSLTSAVDHVLNLQEPPIKLG